MSLGVFRMRCVSGGGEGFFRMIQSEPERFRAKKMQEGLWMRCVHCWSWNAIRQW